MVEEGAICMIRVYLDVVLVIFVSTFVLELATLWATREVVGIKRRFVKMLMGAFFTAISFVAFLFYTAIADAKFNVQIYVCIAIGVMCISTAIAFGNVGFSWLMKRAFYRLVFTVVAGGTSTLVSSFTSGGQLASYVSAVMSVFVVSEAGWGVVHKGVNLGVGKYVNVNVTFGRSTFRVPALLDTGNRLRDPISGYPAVIVEFSAIKNVMPREIRDALESTNGDYEMSGIYEAISSSEWSSRFRIIPFASLGNEDGMMMGFRPDELTVRHGREILSTSKAVVCVKSGQRPLSTAGDYKAILNPDLFKCLF